jgi:5-methylcytosine-specific restriction enzyme A
MRQRTGKQLNLQLGLGAMDARYRKDGIWYHPLRAFPGVLFDESGYVWFASESDYKSTPGLKHGPNPNHLHVPAL